VGEYQGARKALARVPRHCAFDGTRDAFGNVRGTVSQSVQWGSGGDDR
jgi:hypothetical protein